MAVPVPQSSVSLRCDPVLNVKFRWKFLGPGHFVRKSLVFTAKAQVALRRPEPYGFQLNPDSIERKFTVKDRYIGAKIALEDRAKLTITRAFWLDHSTKLTAGVAFNFTTAKPELSVKLAPFRSRRKHFKAAPDISPSQLPAYRVKHQLVVHPLVRLEPIAVLQFIPEFSFSTAQARSVGLGQLTADLAEMNLLIDVTDPEDFIPKLFDPEPAKNPLDMSAAGSPQHQVRKKLRAAQDRFQMPTLKPRPRLRWPGTKPVQQNAVLRTVSEQTSKLPNFTALMSRVRERFQRIRRRRNSPKDNPGTVMMLGQSLEQSP